MKHLFTLSLLLFTYHASAQEALRWVVEGALQQTTVSDPTTMATIGTSYSFYENDILPTTPSYTPGVDPVLWGSVITKDVSGNIETHDFEILVESDNIAGSRERQVTVYAADSTMDFQTGFEPSPLSQDIRIQVNVFEPGTRTNTVGNPGTGGTPKALSIGFARPNNNITSVARLHSAEVYYIEDLTSNFPIGAFVDDPCSQVDTFITGLAGSDLIVGAEDIDGTSLQTAKTNGTYPYNHTGGRTYLRVLEAQNTCDPNNNNRLETTEAQYNVYFKPLSSFIIGRQDIKKGSNTNTGVKSALGFFLVQDFDPARIPALPIELTAFTGAFESNNVTLTWTTASEINNDYFEVQHSKNGIDWTTIAEVDGHGNSTEIQHYTLHDAFFTAGINYYRLKQTDFDGTSSLSKVIAVQTNTTAATALRVFPNPTSDKVYFSKRLDLNQTNIQLYNATGQEISSLLQKNAQEIDLQAVPSGVYWLKIQDLTTQQVYTQKIMKR